MTWHMQSCVPLMLKSTARCCSQELSDWMMKLQELEGGCHNIK